MALRVWYHFLGLLESLKSDDDHLKRMSSLDSLYGSKDEMPAKFKDDFLAQHGIFLNKHRALGLELFSLITQVYYTHGLLIEHKKFEFDKFLFVHNMYYMTLKLANPDQ